MKIDEQNFTCYVTSIVVGKVLCVYMYDLFDGIVCGIIQVTENNTQNHTFHWNDNSYKYLLTSSNTLLATVNVPFNFPLVLLYTYDSHWDPDSVLFCIYIFWCFIPILFTCNQQQFILLLCVGFMMISRSKFV